MILDEASEVVISNMVFDLENLRETADVVRVLNPHARKFAAKELVEQMKSIIIEKNTRSNGVCAYDLKVYENRLMVHHMVFVDPEVAEFYADNYCLKVWGNSQFSLMNTMH